MQETQVRSRFGKISHAVEPLSLCLRQWSLCSRTLESQLLISEMREGPTLLATREKPEQLRRPSTAKSNRFWVSLRKLVKSILRGGRWQMATAGPCSAFLLRFLSVRGQMERPHTNHTPSGFKKCILLKWSTFHYLKSQKLAVYDKNNFQWFY